MTEYEYLLGNILTLQQSGLQRLMLVPGQGPRASKAPQIVHVCARAPSPNKSVSASVPDRGMEQRASCCIQLLDVPCTMQTLSRPPCIHCIFCETYPIARRHRRICAKEAR